MPETLSPDSIRDFRQSEARSQRPGFDSILSSASGNNFIHPQDKTAYKVYIFTDNASRGKNREALFVEAFLPEDFSFAIGSEWSAPFAEGTNNNAMNLLGQALGTKFTTQGLTALFWSGSSNLDLTLPLVFTAESNYNDVQKPIRDLIKLSLPTINSWNFFSAPGPTVKNIDEIAEQGKKILENTGKDLQASKDPGKFSSASENSLLELGRSALKNFGQADIYNNRIQLWLGNFMRFPSVVVKSVDQNYKTIMDPSGVPMAVTVNVTFSTHMTPSAQDFEAYFQNR
jgi:hypothetical protein